MSLAVIVLEAKSNRLADLKPLISDLLIAIDSRTPGTVKLVTTD